MHDHYQVFVIYNEDRNSLEIYRNKELVSEYLDNTGPEDNNFFRDYDWIDKELMKAYQYGRRDSQREILSKIYNLKTISEQSIEELLDKIKCCENCSECCDKTGCKLPIVNRSNSLSCWSITDNMLGD